jgi:catechol 2,3-dioxygenase-like lactoylglutathione lyase family enzyme
MHVLQSRVLLRPRDFERSVAFYERQLGLVRYREWGAPPRRGVVYFLGGGFLELTEGGHDTRPRGVRLWLQVADVAAVHAELGAAAVPIVEPPERKPWGLIEMLVEDPDGLPLVVIETPLDHPLRRRD